MRSPTGHDDERPNRSTASYTRQNAADGIERAHRVLARCDGSQAVRLSRVTGRLSPNTGTKGALRRVWGSTGQPARLWSTSFGAPVS